MRNAIDDFDIMTCNGVACCMCGEPIQEWDLYMIPPGSGTLQCACESCADLFYENFGGDNHE